LKIFLINSVLKIFVILKIFGIKDSYKKEDLIGKQVVRVDNLELAVLRGVESQGMLLAASDETGITIVSLRKKNEIR
jgi:methionyl-tRNA synthetase